MQNNTTSKFCLQHSQQSMIPNRIQFRCLYQSLQWLTILTKYQSPSTRTSFYEWPILNPVTALSSGITGVCFLSNPRPDVAQHPSFHRAHWKHQWTLSSHLLKNKINFILRPVCHQFHVVLHHSCAQAFKHFIGYQISQYVHTMSFLQSSRSGKFAH